MMRRRQTLVLLVYCFAQALSFLSPFPPSLPLQRRFSLSQKDQQKLEDDDFSRKCRLHKTLTSLRQQLPVLLTRPLLPKDVESVYSKDFILVGPHNEELASGQEELVTLSTTLVAATAAARQANTLAAAFQALDNSTTATTTTALYQVDCKLALDSVNLKCVRVQWEVQLPAAPLATAPTLVGLSELVFNDEGLVNVHRLLDVSFDGNTVNAVGETLATLRRAVKSSPMLASLSPLAASLPNLVRDGLLQQAAQTEEEATPTSRLPPLFISESIQTAFTTDNNNNNMTLIDNNTSTTPLPGSLQWTNYSSSFQTVSRFIDYGLPVLSGSDNTDEVTKLFAPNAQLLGLDGKILSQGGVRIATFYQTLASLRKGAPSSNWKILNVAQDWNRRSVVVNWSSRTPIPVEGRDFFQLSFTENEPVIERIEQLELVIGGNRVQDPEWFRTFLTTIETGRNSVGADVVLDLLQMAGRGSTSTEEKTISRREPPQLNDEAAASVYKVMCAMHSDLPTLVDTSASPRYPPAQEYISSDIELKGYLDEMLVKGLGNYKRVSNVLISTLQGALRSKRVTCESPPAATIEFTSAGCLRVSLVIRLKASSVPLTLELVSEYTLNNKGRIQQHKLVESRINGQLTPGDVVSRWIKGSNGAEQSQNPIFIQSMLDTFMRGQS